MPRKAGDIPAWAAVVAALVVPLFAAMAAWGAASARLEQHDEELRGIRTEIVSLVKSVSKLEGRLTR
jgi:hypothetical protein